MATATADDHRFHEIVPRDAELERLGTGFQFTEGPLWHKDGYLLFSDMPGDTRRRWDRAGGIREVASPSNKGNGMTFDAGGRLIVCEHSTSSLVRMEADGIGSAREVLASHYDGSELNSPNDVVPASDGSLYFSDPSYGRLPGFGIERDQQLSFQGVFRVRAGDGKLELLADDFEQPNGLCFSPDESIVYVNDSPRAHIRAFDVLSDGSLGGERVFVEAIGDGQLETGLADGMKCDEHGNVWVTGPGGIWIFSPEAKRIGVLEVPETVGNMHWGGDDWSWLYICASTSLYRIRTGTRGRQEPFMKAGRTAEAADG